LGEIDKPARRGQQEGGIRVSTAVQAARPGGRHYYIVFLACGHNHFTQVGKQFACIQRSSLIAFNDGLKDRLRGRITKATYEYGIFKDGHITMPAYENKKAPRSGFSSNFWSCRRREPPRRPPCSCRGIP
jgi:hypothetical protein